MARKRQNNMFGGFGVAAQQRKEQQEQIEAAVTGRPVSGVPSVGREKKRGEDATTITLAISREDKALLKSWAATHGTTMSDMLHDWIVRTCGGGEG
jgi:hypothetical protein